MAASASVNGFGTIFAYESATSVFTALAEVLSVTPPSLNVETAETTHMGSDDGYREYIATLKDGGEVTVNLNYVEASATLLQTLINAGIETFKITFPGSSTFTFTGIPTAFAFDDVVIDDKIVMSLTIKVTGKPTYLAV
ncbi:phage tail tube protein [Brevundimonas sp. TWP2-3-4b1]|uniref:phage tail tube protein n=1 Tax=Brevundimonas sp. TWP2-3-4b1 TaxID=2804580 RepID=UPI003CEA7F94